MGRIRSELPEVIHEVQKGNVCGSKALALAAVLTVFNREPLTYARAARSSACLLYTSDAADES